MLLTLEFHASAGHYGDSGINPSPIIDLRKGKSPPVYQEHFNLTDLPFENTPNPAFFYGGGQYRECLSAMLHYVANRRGMMGLSGPIGVGKTTLVHTLRRVLPDNTKVISLIHPESTPLELLTYVAQGLDLHSIPESRLRAVEVVKNELERLDRAGGVCLLLVDEAQLLTLELMEQLRLLSNLETEVHKLIQVILVGQPELVTMLQRPELAAVRQRISLMKVLSSLTPEESLYYIAHRLSRAGSELELFSDQAVKTVIGYSGGIPRIINQLCEGALVSAFGAERDFVDTGDVEEAAANLLLVGEKMFLADSGEKTSEPVTEPESPPRSDSGPSLIVEKVEQAPPPPVEEVVVASSVEPAPDLEDSEPEPRPGELPRKMVFESSQGIAPPRPGRTREHAPSPTLALSTEDPEQTGKEQETGEATSGKSATLKNGWEPPPPVPAPEESEPRSDLFKPLLILAASLLLLSLALGFYLVWDNEPAGNNDKHSTITVPLKPRPDSPKGD